MLLTRYAQIATTRDKAKGYLVGPVASSISISHHVAYFQDFARSQLDYVLGDNPMSGALLPTPKLP